MVKCFNIFLIRHNKKLLSIILNELDDVTKTIPLLKAHFEQFLENIKADVTDHMVKLVNRELENQILKIDQENKTLRNKVAELQKKIQALENEIDEDLVGAKAIIYSL